MVMTLPSLLRPKPGREASWAPRRAKGVYSGVRLPLECHLYSIRRVATDKSHIVTALFPSCEMGIMTQRPPRAGVSIKGEKPPRTPGREPASAASTQAAAPRSGLFPQANQGHVCPKPVPPSPPRSWQRPPQAAVGSGAKQGPSLQHLSSLLGSSK